MDHGQHADPAIVTGNLLEQSPESIVLALPGTDYQLHLAVKASPAVNAVGTLQGRVIAQARRVDIIDAGGIYIEPVLGRPRRIQGRVIATNAADNTLTVKAVAPFVCKLSDLQKADQFPVGVMVSFDIERGALFEPM